MDYRTYKDSAKNINKITRSNEPNYNWLKKNHFGRQLHLISWLGRRRFCKLRVKVIVVSLICLSSAAVVLLGKYMRTCVEKSDWRARELKLDAVGLPGLWILCAQWMLLVEDGPQLTHIKTVESTIHESGRKGVHSRYNKVSGVRTENKGHGVPLEKVSRTLNEMKWEKDSF